MYKGPNRKFEKKQQQRFGDRRGGNRRMSGFGTQLLEKQRLRFVYGIREKVMKNYFAAASREGGDVVQAFRGLLERRLDNVVYRLGFASTRSQARQVVNHGHIFVNGRRINIPAHRVQPGDVVMIRTQSQNKGVFQPIKTTIKKHTPPAWMKLDADALSGTVVRIPSSQDVQDPINISLVVEFYSR
ncbi:MAG: 30S ribosomal protein S4 [Parcubacteria group bacterium GW2011_GWA2_47_8]|nr:MAG: 30S ribosomal protein S4 [Parcubacteria group bacterium GW2011_GWA2_47_8]OHB19399.1 MAG: 30S ribosomal protein S4 [Parcubacteria group bacterium RIFCSPHIGHO2_01_FULL_47_10b]